MGNDKIHGNDVSGSARMGMNLGEDVEGPAPLENALTVQAAQESAQERYVAGFLNTTALFQTRKLLFAVEVIGVKGCLPRSCVLTGRP